MDLSAQRSRRHDESVGTDDSTSYEKQLTSIEELREKLRKQHNPAITEEDNWIKRDFIDIKTLNNNPELLKTGVFPTKTLVDRRADIMKAVMTNFKEVDFNNDNESLIENIKDFIKTVKYIVKTAWRIIKKVGRWIITALKSLAKVARKLVVKAKPLVKKAWNVIKTGGRVLKKVTTKGLNVLRKSKIVGKIVDKVKPIKKVIAKSVEKITKPIKNLVVKGKSEIVRRVTAKKVMKEVERQATKVVKKAAQPGMSKKVVKFIFKSKIAKLAAKSTRLLPWIGAVATAGIEFYDLWGNLEAIQALKENGIIDDEKEKALKKFAYATSGAAVGAEMVTNTTVSTLGLGAGGVGALAGGVAGIAAGETARYIMARNLVKDPAQLSEWQALFDQGHQLLDNGYKLKNEVTVDEEEKKYYEDLSKYLSEKQKHYEELVKNNTITQEMADKFIKEDNENWLKYNPNAQTRNNVVEIDRPFNKTASVIDINKYFTPTNQTPIPKESTIQQTPVSFKVSNDNYEAYSPQQDKDYFKDNEKTFTPISYSSPTSSPEVSTLESNGISKFTPIQIPNPSQSNSISTSQKNEIDIPTESDDDFSVIYNVGHRN